MDCDENLGSLVFSDQFDTPFPNDEMNEINEFMEIDFEEQTPETNFDILLTKHLSGHMITDIELQQLPEDERNTLFLIQNKAKAKNKRPDECQKLFYKRAFKYSEQKFFKRCKNKSRKMSQFYHHHFEVVSKSFGVPLTTFYHPDKKTKPGLKVFHRTFNNKYIQQMLLSLTLKEDIKEYHKIFIKECQKERKKKIFSFASSLKKIKEKAKEDPKMLIKHLQSSQCKIPWTDEDIQRTWELAQKDLYQLDPDEKLNKCELKLLKDENSCLEYEMMEE